jgi:hypothetical protein
MPSDAQRKPVIYLLVILPTLVVGAVCLIATLIEAYSQVTGVPRSSVPRLNGLLIALPALFLWIPLSLLIANVVLCCVPPLRRIAERYAAQTERPGLIESQQALLKMLGVIALVCVPLILLGFLV